jgi:hypothetical protein
MLDFPKSTVFNKRIPKQKFYEQLSVSSRLEQQFVKEIDSIYWKNKFSPETLNITEGKNVREIEVFEIILKEKSISKNIIEVIDREIPYHLIFVLRYMEFGQVWISFKEASKSREGKFKVESYYVSEWLLYKELTLDINGMDLDKIYENFLIQVAGDKLKLEYGKDIKEAVFYAKEQEKLEAHIEKLESKINKESQFNRQVKLIGELRQAKSKLRE